MRYLKTLGLAVLTAAALMAITGSASATTLTSPGGITLGVGTVIKASSEGVIEAHTKLAKYTCQNSTLDGEVTKAGGASETVYIDLGFLWFQECGNHTMTVLDPGALEIHTDTANADRNGTVTWRGALITTLSHFALIGTRHCLYSAENIPFGTISGSKNREGKTATLSLEADPLSVVETDISFYCAQEVEDEEGEIVEQGPLLTGSYTFDTPDYLDVD